MNKMTQPYMRTFSFEFVDVKNVLFVVCLLTLLVICDAKAYDNIFCYTTLYCITKFRLKRHIRNT